MAKWYGKVGYAETVLDAPDAWAPSITERYYYGDVLKNMNRLEKTDNLNDNLSLNNIISILADPFAYQNFHLIRYVEFMGTLWKVTNVEVQYPRIILTIGGVWNG